jgi:branched-chain amino acid transport system permease protein
MDAWLFIEQGFNGLQLGVMLFLMAAGLTLVFGIMDLINLAHGSLYMIGAYLSVAFGEWTQSFLLGLALAVPATALVGMVLELVVLRTLYERDHLDQVLATFGLILFLNEMVRIVWGAASIYSGLPAWLTGNVEFIPGAPYPVYRLLIIAVGLAVAGMIYWLVSHTRVGMLIRAGASNREMVGALGVDIRLLFTLVFGVGAAFAGLAGMLMGPITTVESGMGDAELIRALVVIVIGGIGSIRGAFVAAVLVGLVEIFGRGFLPLILRAFLSNTTADAVGPALASMSIYVLMAAVLFFRPSGLFPARTG